MILSNTTMTTHSHDPGVFFSMAKKTERGMQALPNGFLDRISASLNRSDLHALALVPSLSFPDRMSRTKADDYTLFLATAMRIGLIQTTTSGPTAHLKSAGKPGDALKEDTDFVRLLKHDVEDAHFVLLCALLPNLESFAINGVSIYPTLDCLFYTPNFDALDEINAGAAFTEAQIVEALGASTAIMEKPVISPTAPSIDPRTREYSNLKSLVIPHLCLLPTVEGYPSLDDIIENLRFVIPRSISHLHLRHCLPVYMIDIVVEQLAALKSCEWLTDLKDITLHYAADAQHYDIPYTVVVFNLKVKVAEALEKAGIVLNVDIEPQLNSTSETAAATTVTATWRPKVHGESSAYGWDTSTAGSDSRVRVDATASDFDLTTPTSVPSHEPIVSTSPIDIGTIIQTLIPPFSTASRAWAIPTVHFEDSASGWDEPTSTVHYESSATGFEGPSSELAHWESSATGWEQTGHRDLSSETSRYRTIEVTDDPWTKNLQPSQTAAPAQVTSAPSKTITDYPPPPAITHNGVTVRPIAVTRQATVTLSDGSVTTTGQVKFQVAIGSSTLKIGNPVTINNVVFDVTTDAAGSIVLHAGDLTTTLPRPTAGEVRTVADDTPARLNIATSVTSGTTLYVFAGQTLAPGQPVTIGDTPISITTSGGQTVLYVGDRTTTLPAAGDIQTLSDWTTISTISAGTQGTAASTEAASAVPTSKKSGSSAARKLNAALIYFVVSITTFVFTLRV
ncbi:hypothetical protein E8E11_011553 [Didymella keratinophila]|nr:hypothetical protein E8E11_011553 [Didymella keratinophila]